MTTAVAIRAQGIGRYFGPSLEADGAEQPREAWRSLLTIAGLEAIAPAPNEEQAALTVAPPGHVLRDVSLEIETGSVVCLTGPAGSGKSVLLRLLSGELPPTTGRIEIYGSLRSLLTRGGDVDATKTASENIRLSEVYADADPDGAARYAAEVIAFAELEGFEDVPLRTYSTGMLMRLNVALVLCGAPSLILVDDVLAVGDVGFQRRCIDRIHELKEAGCTMVVAFSDEALIAQIATRVVELGGGGIVYDSSETDAQLSARDQGDAEVAWQLGGSLPEDEVVVFRAVDGELVRDGDEVFFVCRLVVEGKADGLRCRPVVSLLTEKGVILFRSLFPRFAGLDAPGQVFSVRIPTGLLPAGRYTVSVATATYQGDRVFATKGHNTVTLTVRRERTSGGDEEDEPVPLLQPALEWEVVVLDATASDVVAP